MSTIQQNTMYDITKEKAVPKERHYYHITDVKNIPSIAENGLRANEDGHIFVFTDERYANDIAVNQCGHFDDYTLFEIDSKGINGKVIMDRVAEFSARHHRIIIQPHIKAQYIDLVDAYHVDHDKMHIELLFRTLDISIDEAIILYNDNDKDFGKAFEAGGGVIHQDD